MDAQRQQSFEELELALKTMVLRSAQAPGIPSKDSKDFFNAHGPRLLRMYDTVMEIRERSFDDSEFAGLIDKIVLP